MFAAWGRVVYRFRWLVLVGSALLLTASIVGLRVGGTLTNFNPPSLEYARAINLMQAELPHQGGSGFELIFRSQTLTARDTAFQQALLNAIEPLRADARVSGVVTPYDPSAPTSAALVSRDGHAALAIVSVKDDYGPARSFYNQLLAEVHPGPLQITPATGLAIGADFDRYLQADLHRAEFISLPLALILLLLVFGTLVAAVLPLGVGGLAVVGGLAGVGLLARVTDVSTYATNIVTLIGLGVAIDYSLFIVNRFREELQRGRSEEESLSIAIATSGRAVTFSGLTVAIGLSGMLFFPGSFLASMGLAGATVVAIAVLYALTFLAALLAILGPRVNRGRLPLLRPRSGSGLWHAVATRVMRRPVLVLVPVLAILVLLASPFLQLRLANGDVNLLPPGAPSHRGADMLVGQFPGQNLTYISVVVRYPEGDPLTTPRIGDLYDYAARLEQLPDVERVESIVSQPSLDRATTIQVLSGSPAAMPADLRTLVHQTVGAHIALLSVVTAQPAESDAARAVVHTIRQLTPPPNAQVLVTGQTAYDVDLIDFILQRIPWAVAFVMVMTYLVLFLLVGSVVLPLKAVLMNIVSIAASFGALVWIFQQGHLSTFLNFAPSSIDPSVPVLLFCIIFGLSMDYEVLLLSRIQEEYRRGTSTTEAVAAGLERSGRLITGAAAIMVAVFAAFGLADVVLIKSLGLGLAIAVVIDATLVRALIVPAIMRLLGVANWWSPRPLARLHRRLGLGESAPRPRPIPVPET